MMNKLEKWAVEVIEQAVEYGADQGRGWHNIVKKCEQLLGCPDTAESPLMCSLPNLIRDLIHREENKAGQERKRIVANIREWANSAKVMSDCMVRDVRYNELADRIENE